MNSRSKSTPDKIVTVSEKIGKVFGTIMMTAFLAIICLGLVIAITAMVKYANKLWEWSPYIALALFVILLWNLLRPKNITYISVSK